MNPEGASLVLVLIFQRIADIGVAGEFWLGTLQYNIHEYANDYMAVYVGEAVDGEDADNLNGLVLSIYVFRRGVPTARGLQVADMPDRAWELYLSGFAMPRFSYFVDGSVCSYAFSTRWWSMPLQGLPVKDHGIKMVYDWSDSALSHMELQKK